LCGTDRAVEPFSHQRPLGAARTCWGALWRPASFARRPTGRCPGPHTLIWAEAAAAILTDQDRPTSETPVLTAADAIDLDDVAATLSGLAGRTIRRVIVDDEDYVADLAAHGVPEAGARMFLTMFRAARRGGFAVTDPTLARLVGREPRPIRLVLKAVTAAH